MSTTQEAHQSTGPLPTSASELLARLDRLPLSRWHVMFYCFCVLAWMADSVDGGIQAPINAVLVKDWGISLVEVGLIGSAVGTGQLCGSVVFGWLADMVGRRRGLAFATFTCAGFTGLAALTQDLPQLLVAVFFVGMGTAGIAPIALAYIAEYAPLTWRGRFVAWSHTAFSLSTFFASLIGIYVIVPFGWRAGYLVGITPVIIGFAGLVGLIPESARYLIKKGRLAQADDVVASVEKNVLGPRAAQYRSEPVSPSSTTTSSVVIAQVRPNSMWSSIRTLFSPGTRAATLVILPLWTFGYFGPYAFNAVLLPGRVGISLSDVLAAVAVGSFGSVAGGIIGGFLDDIRWLGPRRVLYASLILWPIPTLGQWYWSHDLPTLAFYTVLWGIVAEMYSAGLFPYTTSSFSEEIRGLGMGVAFGLFRVLTIATPLAIGYVVQATGDIGPIMIATVATKLVTVLVLAVYGRETRESVTTPPAFGGQQPPAQLSAAGA